MKNVLRVGKQPSVQVGAGHVLHNALLTRDDPSIDFSVHMIGEDGEKAATGLLGVLHKTYDSGTRAKA